MKMYDSIGGAKNKRAYRPDKTVNVDKSLFPELFEEQLLPWGANSRRLGAGCHTTR